MFHSPLAVRPSNPVNLSSSDVSDTNFVPTPFGAPRSTRGGEIVQNMEQQAELARQYHALLQEALLHAQGIMDEVLTAGRSGEAFERVNQELQDLN